MSETPPTETNTWEGFDFQNAGAMLDLVTNLHNRYLVEENPRAFFDEVLRVLLGVSGSDYGFLGEVNHLSLIHI